MQKIQGILFDMDGVLFPTEAMYFAEERAAALRQGYTMPEETLHAMMANSNEVNREVVRASLGDAFDYDRFREEVDGALDAARHKGLPTRPGIAEALPQLKAAGYRLAVCSSAPLALIEVSLRAAGIEEYFEQLTGGDMVAETKPEPDIYLLGAKRLGLAPGRCAAVEDSLSGLRSARAAGCFTIMIPDMRPADEAVRPHTDAVIASAAALPALLAELNQINL